MTKHHKALVRNEPAVGTAIMPKAISRRDYIDASGPMLARLGIDHNNILCAGFKITSYFIEGYTVEPLRGVEPMSSIEIEGVEDEAAAIWVWPFRIEIEAPDVQG